MGRVLLIRPNDFIADAMTSLVTRAGLQAFRVRTPSEFQLVELRGVVGAVVSTAVTSSIPMTFLEAVVTFRKRSMVALVATTMARDDTLATQFVARELANCSLGLVPLPSSPASLAHRQLGTTKGLLVLRKDQIDAPEATTLELLRRHFGLPAEGEHQPRGPVPDAR